jgi:hypothetical protein
MKFDLDYRIINSFPETSMRPHKPHYLIFTNISNNHTISNYCITFDYNDDYKNEEDDSNIIPPNNYKQIDISNNIPTFWSSDFINFNFSIVWNSQVGTFYLYVGTHISNGTFYIITDEDDIIISELYTLDPSLYVGNNNSVYINDDNDLVIINNGDVKSLVAFSINN